MLVWQFLPGEVGCYLHYTVVQKDIDKYICPLQPGMEDRRRGEVGLVSLQRNYYLNLSELIVNTFLALWYFGSDAEVCRTDLHL